MCYFGGFSVNNVPYRVIVWIISNYYITLSVVFWAQALLLFAPHNNTFSDCILFSFFLYPTLRVLYSTSLMLGKIEGKTRIDRGWNGRMASPTQWIWVWANSGRQWRTGKPGVLQFMGLQRVGYSLVTDWTTTSPIALLLVSNSLPFFDFSPVAPLSLIYFFIRYIIISP